MRSGDVAWIATAAGITAYEIGAALKHGELLSEACDRYRARRPITTYTAIIYLAGHLARLWPRHLDPLCLIAAAGRRATR